MGFEILPPSVRDATGMRATESDIVVKAHLQDGSELDLSNHVHMYSDRHPIDGIPTYSLMLTPTIDGEPATEVVDNGDILEVGLVSTDGRTGPHRLGQYNTTMIGTIRSVGMRQDVSQGSLRKFCQVSGSSLAGFMATDSINYYLALGSAAGYLKALALTPIDTIAMRRLDEALAAYLDNVAYNVMRIARPQGTIRDMLGYALESVPGVGLFDSFWANYEGTLWSFVQNYSEQPLHEVYQGIVSLERFQALGGIKHTPKAFGEDRAVSALVMRPRPFPHGLPGGAGSDFSAWQALPLHDLLDPDWFLDSADDELTDKGDREVVNFVYCYPKALTLDESMQITWAPPLEHEHKWQQFGYKPLSWATNLWGHDAAKEDALEYFRMLNWRLAGQWSSMDEYFEGTVGVRLAPHIRPGERVRLNNTLGDDTTTFEYYVIEVSNTFFVRGERKTTLKLERGLPEDTYRDGSYFVDGWRELPPLRDAALRLTDIRREDEAGPTR